MNKKTSNLVFLLICSLLVFAPLARGGVQGWAVAVIHIITLAALTIYLVQRCLAWDWGWIQTSLDRPILALVVLAFVSTLFSVHRPSSIRAFLLLLNYVVVYYLVVHLTRGLSQLRNMVWAVIGIGILLAVLGLVSFAGLPFFSWWEYHDLPDFGALTATYGNPNNIAGFFEMAIPLALGMLLAGNRESRSLKLHVPIILLFGIALILSMSRGGWTCAMLGLIFLVTVLALSVDFPRRRTAIALTGSAIVLVLVLLSSFPAVQELLTIRAVIDQAGGLDGRLQVTKAVAAMTMDRPLLGFGPGTFAYSFLQYQPPGIQGWYTLAHNDYAHFISEMGLFLPLIMVWMIAALFRHGFARLKSPVLPVRAITLGSMAGIFAILCHSFIDFNLHIPANALFFTVLAALIAAPAPKIKKFRKIKLQVPREGA